MKVLKKINRGFILTCLVVIAVVIYLVGSGIYNGSQKQVIEKICLDFINNEIRYEALPEEYRTRQPEISEEELNEYISKMKTELSAVVSNKIFLDSLERRINSQAAGRGVIKSYVKNNINVKKYQFENGRATVTLSSDVKIEYCTGDVGEMETEDTVILQKQDGEWKIIYWYFPLNDHSPAFDIFTY